MATTLAILWGCTNNWRLNKIFPQKPWWNVLKKSGDSSSPQPRHVFRTVRDVIVAFAHGDQPATCWSRPGFLSENTNGPSRILNPNITPYLMLQSRHRIFRDLKSSYLSLMVCPLDSQCLANKWASTWTWYSKCIGFPKNHTESKIHTFNINLCYS